MVSNSKNINLMNTKSNNFSILCDSDEDSSNFDNQNKFINTNINDDKKSKIIVNNNNINNSSDIQSDDWINETKKKKKNKLKKEEIKLTKEEIILDNNKKEEEIKLDNNIEFKSNNINEIDKPSDYKFQNKWYVWTHDVDSKNWSAESYKLKYTINNIQSFWEFFNVLSKLNQWKFNFFIMKDNSHPTWEHSTNRNGGICSLRIDISQSIDIIEQLGLLLVSESLTEKIDDINGLSFVAKGNWCVLKIWNKNNSNNISNQMPQYLKKIYPALTIKYKENIPEY